MRDWPEALTAGPCRYARGHAPNAQSATVQFCTVLAGRLGYASRMPKDVIDGSAAVVANLESLISAIDSRTPREERTEEPEIARDASSLRQRALDRLASLRLDGE